jgi:hypothetical protein
LGSSIARAAALGRALLIIELWLIERRYIRESMRSSANDHGHGLITSQAVDRSRFICVSGFASTSLDASDHSDVVASFNVSLALRSGGKADIPISTQWAHFPFYLS